MRRTNKLDWLKSHRPLLDRAIFVIALVGVLVAVHLIIQQGRGFDRGCFGFDAPAAQPTVGCEVVTQSEAATLFGVSNGVWGLLFYIAIVALSLGAALTRRKIRAWAKGSRGVLISVGFAYSLYLSYVQYAQLEEFCTLCLISASLAALLFILFIGDLSTNPPLRMQSLPAPREWAYMGLAVVVVGLLAGVDVVYFNQLDDGATAATSQQASADGEECFFDPARSAVEDYEAFIQDYDPTSGDSTAPVTLIEFLDPNCPHCADNHDVMKEVSAAHGDQFFYVYKPLVVVGQHSIIQVAALYLADEEGLFEEMLDEQFNRQQRQGLSLDDLREIAEEIGMDTANFSERLQNEAYLEWMQVERERALDEVGISGVPTIMINGRFVPGSVRTAECIGELIQDEAAISAAVGR